MKKRTLGLLVVLGILFLIWFLILTEPALGGVQMESFLAAEAVDQKEKNTIELIHDSVAVSKEYEKFFELFTQELLKSAKSSPRKISGQHRILVIELVNPRELGDARIFIVLDGAEPNVVHWQKVRYLEDSKIMQEFVKETTRRVLRLFRKENKKGDETAAKKVKM